MWKRCCTRWMAWGLSQYQPPRNIHAAYVVGDSYPMERRVSAGGVVLSEPKRKVFASGALIWKSPWDSIQTFRAGSAKPMMKYGKHLGGGRPPQPQHQTSKARSKSIITAKAVTKRRHTASTENVSSAMPKVIPNSVRPRCGSSRHTYPTATKPLCQRISSRIWLGHWRTAVVRHPGRTIARR